MVATISIKNDREHLKINRNVYNKENLKGIIDLE